MRMALSRPTGQSGAADGDALLARFRRERSEHAFRALYGAHGDQVLRFCRRLLGRSASEAEDAAQECWLRAVRMIDRFEGRSGFATWICGIAVNVVRERRRDEDRAHEIAAAAGDAEPLAYVGDPGDVRDLHAALSLLSNGYRAAVVLHDIEGFTHEEVGEILGISPGTAKSQLSRARARLREILIAPDVSGADKGDTDVKS